MSPAEIEKWVSDAATAFAAAGDLDSLKSARLAHLGDRERRAEQEFPRFLELPSDHVALGGNAQVAAKEF